MAGKPLLRAVEFVVWVVVVSAGVIAVTGAVGFLAGGGLLGAKYALFVVGFLLFGVGSLAIQPRSPRYQVDDLSGQLEDRTQDGRGGGIGRAIRDPMEAVKRQFSFEDRETRVDDVVQRVPPLSDAELPVDDRVGHELKVFAVSLVVLAVSIWMEFGLGVRV